MFEHEQHMEYERLLQQRIEYERLECIEYERSLEERIRVASELSEQRRFFSREYVMENIFGLNESGSLSENTDPIEIPKKIKFLNKKK